MKTKLIVILLASLFVFAGCAGPATQVTAPSAIPTQPGTIPPTTTPVHSQTPTLAGESVTTAQELTGTWLLTSHPDWAEAYWLVREDGRYTFSPNLDGSSGQSGKWVFENGEFLISDDSCPERGKYAARRSDEGGSDMLVFSLIQDNCPTRTRILTAAPAKLVPAEIVQATVHQPTATFSPTPIPLALNENLDIPYTSERALDVYAPQQPGEWPVVIFLHGGGVNKGSVKGVSRAIAGRGAVVFAPTWHSTESNVLDAQGLPVGYNDAACAVRFARAKAAEFGGDASHIVLIGHSSGGAAGATIALAGDDFQGDCVVQEGSALPDAFVGLDGAYELLKYATKSTVEKNPKAWERLNPYDYIDRRPIRQELVFYINTGLEQELIADGTSLTEALEAAGYMVKYQNFPGTDHMAMASSRPDLMLMVMAALYPVTAPSEPEITFSGDTCTYRGPTQLPTSFNVNWIVEDGGHRAYMFIIGTLDEGKTLQDITSIPAGDPAPTWFHILGRDFAVGLGAYTKSIDLSINAAFKEGPIYLICFLDDTNGVDGTIGPIDIVQ